MGLGKTKTDTNANKKAPNEPNASNFIIKGLDIWNQSASIPSTIPSANSSIANVYLDSVSGALQTTEDGASSDNRTWSTGVTNWIPPTFGATYQLKVYAAASDTNNPQTNGTQLFETGSGNDDEWYFDYQSGILNFIGSNLPSAMVWIQVMLYLLQVQFMLVTQVLRQLVPTWCIILLQTLQPCLPQLLLKLDFIKGNDEYGLFIANRTTQPTQFYLTLIGTADSAVTDAGTLTTTIVHTTGASVVIGNVSQNKKVQTVTVDVTTAFDGSAPTLTIVSRGYLDELTINDY